MKKNVLKVFGVIGALLLGFLVWAVVFNNGGVLQTAYNGMISPVNGVYQKITGGTTDLIPEWEDANNGQDLEEGDSEIE